MLGTSFCIETIAQKTLTCNKSIYSSGDSVAFTYTNAVTTKDWIGIYTKGTIPNGGNYVTWAYVPNTGNGTKTFKYAFAVGMYDTYFMCCDKYDSVSAKGPSFQVIAALGVQEQTNKEVFTIYPNPSDGSFSVKFSKETSGTFEMYDITGRLLLTNIFRQLTFYPVIASGFGKGVYFIKLINDEKYFIHVQKLIVE